MTSPAELQAIRERIAYDHAHGLAPPSAAHDRRTLLALYDAQSVTLQKEHQDRVEAQCSEERWRSKSEAQSDEVRRLREALVTSRKVLVVACGEKAPFVRVALDVIDAALGSQP